MKQINTFQEKKNHIDKTMISILSKYPSGSDNRVMYDLINNLIGDEYGYISARIDLEKGNIKQSLVEEIYNFQEYDKKLDQIIKVYEEIRDNKIMVKKILKKAGGKPSIIEKEDLINFYNEIKKGKT